MTDPERPASAAASRPTGTTSRNASSPSPQPPSAADRRSSRSPAADAAVQTQEEQHQQTQQAHQQPSQFQPLFTLITDSTTRATHHPRVHYVFSDDDPDILTEALAHHHSSLTSAEHEPSPMQGSAGSSAGGTSPGPVQERAIVLDLVPKEDGSAGYEVAWASSLSADWAVTSARVSRMEGDDAPVTTTAAQDDGSGDSNLMLRIEGLGIEGTTGAGSTTRHRGKGSSPLAAGEGGELQLSTASGSTSKQAAIEEDYGLLIDEFEKRMGVLRKVVSAGEERQRKVAADMEKAQEQSPPQLEGEEEERPAAGDD